MSDEYPGRDGIVARVRSLVEVFAETDLVRVRIEREGEHIELGRPASRRPLAAAPEAAALIAEPAPSISLETIRADLVGIFRLGRPAPFEGEILTVGRELAYVEALGIRNPVRSRGAGRIVSILSCDGDAVDYGHPLFELDRG
jgi:biotin carboxyl carrier protein